MKTKIAAAIAAALLAAGCASGSHQAWGCTPAGQKAETAQLQVWLDSQSAGDASALTTAQTWANQAAAACKSGQNPPPLP